MKVVDKQNRNLLLDDLVNMNSPEMAVNKIQKRFQSPLIHDLSESSSNVRTPVSNLNISWDDNFTNVSAISSQLSTVDNNYSTFQSAMIAITHNNEESDLSDSDNSWSDDTMSTDSDNQNMPDIDYEEELRSRLYYYANFMHQQDILNREVEGCESPEETVILDEPSDTTLREVVGCEDERVHKPTQRCSRFKTTPTACSTMIDNSNLRLPADNREFIPTASSTMVSDLIPRVSSTITNNLGTNGSFDRVHCIPQNDNISGFTRDSLVCCSRGTLSVFASSSSLFCRDEFSLDATATQNRCSLPRTSTVARLNNDKQYLDQLQDAQIHSTVFKSRKQTPIVLKALQKMKKRTKGLTRKSKSQDKQPTSQQGSNVLDVNLKDKKTLAKKLHRFRESFRRKDTRQIIPLATL